MIGASIDNPFSITIGTILIGGTSKHYQLHGPYRIKMGANALSLTFDVVVVTSSYEELVERSAFLEENVGSRDYSVVIDVDGSKWTFLNNANLLNVEAEIEKSGDEAFDVGYSRKYTVSISALRPATDGGLRDLEVAVEEEDTRRKIITMSGTYVHAGASGKYRTDFEAEANTWLDTLAHGLPFQLVGSTYKTDRNDHVCVFSRTYAQILMDQSYALRDHPFIADHRVTFTEQILQPGASVRDMQRLRRVVGVYECGLDVTKVQYFKVTSQGESPIREVMQSAFRAILRPLILAAFTQNFRPKAFCVDSQDVNYDETSQRIFAQIGILYHPTGAAPVLETTLTTTIKESRALRSVPVHDGGELSAYVHAGFLDLQRITTRNVIVLGPEIPIRHLGTEGRHKTAPALELLSSPEVRESGWNRIDASSSVSTLWVGIGGIISGVAGVGNVGQLQLTSLDETVVEQYTEEPATGFTSSAGSAPSTPAPRPPVSYGPVTQR